MTKRTESAGTQYIKNTEAPAHNYINIIDYLKDAENVNGRWSMLGLVALLGA